MQLEEKDVCCSIRMAPVPRFAFFTLLLLSYQCEAKAENCSETQCLLLPVGDDLVTSEFRLKASEKGVRLVYINLAIGNASYDPLELPDVFLPHRWVWANTIHEPMLSLPEDYDILSAGLLNYQVRSVDVKLKDQPSGCLAKLNSTSQNLAIGRMLLENVTGRGPGDILQKRTPVVCVALISRACGELRYHCCDMHKEARTEPATIRCDQRIDVGNWAEKVLNISFILLSFTFGLFAPALPLALPDYVFSLEDEVEKENRPEEFTNIETTGYQRITNPVTVDDQDNHGQRETGADRSKTEDVVLHTVTSTDPTTTATDNNSNNTMQQETGQKTSNCVRNSRDEEEESEFIPVDDSSPMNLSTLLRESVQKLPDIPLSFNIKLAVMCLCVYPCVLYVQMGLYHTLKKESVDEIVRKHLLVDCVFSSGTKFVNVTVNFDDLALLVKTIHIVMIFTILILVLFLKPNDFSRGEKELCGICRVISQTNNSFNFSLASQDTLGDDIHRHLKILRHYVWSFTVAYGKIVVSMYYCLLSGYLPKKMRKESRGNRIFWGFFRLISFILALPLIIVIGVFFLLILILVLIITLVSFSPVSTFVSFSQMKILNCFGIQEKKKLILGLIVGICFPLMCTKASFLLFTNSCLFIGTVVVYIIIGLALNVRIVTPCLAFLLVLTTNLHLCGAKLQSKYKEVKKMISQRLQELHMNSSVPKDTIRAEIYWFVRDKVLPVKSEMCRMLRNMVLVIAFLFLALFSIVFFGNEYDISTLTTTISVFFTGSIPALFLKVLTANSNIVGWAKIKMERKINKAVIEYRDSRNGEAVEQQILETLV